MTIVKICGITNLADAVSAARYGADELGFNFCVESPRYVEPRVVAEIVPKVPDELRKVGVFVNETLDRVIEIERLAGLDSIQLHGDETSDYVSELRRRTNARIIKALRIGPHVSPDTVAAFSADAVLIDSFSPRRRGGTGETCDWSAAAAVVPLVEELYLAGGLNALNVAAAVQAVRPYAVDAASGVESAPGLKDEDKLRAFIRNAKNA